MNEIKIVKNSACRAPITGLVLFVWSVQSQVLIMDQPGRDIADKDARLVAEWLPELSGQYKGRRL